MTAPKKPPILSSREALQNYPAVEFASRLCLFLLFVMILMPGQTAHAESAQSLDKRGQTAEARKDYDAAYEAYQQAHEKKPKDIRYETHLQNVRFMAATQHIDRGRVLRQNGDYTGAIRNFMRAAEIDPSNETALQEINIAQHEQAALMPVQIPPTQNRWGKKMSFCVNMRAARRQ